MKKKFLKQTLILCLMLALGVTMAACGNNQNDQTTPVELSPASAVHSFLGQDDDVVQATYGPGSEDTDSSVVWF